MDHRRIFIVGLLPLLLGEHGLCNPVYATEASAASGQPLQTPTSPEQVTLANPLKLSITKDAPDSDLPELTGPLGIDDAVKAGLKHNLDISAAEQSWIGSKFLTRAQLAQFGPSASFSTFFSDSSLNQMLFFQPGWTVAAPTMQPIVRRTSLSFVFGGTQPLFTGGRLLGGYRAARARERQSLSAYNGNRIAAALNIKEAYWEAAWIQAKLGVDTDYVHFREGSTANMKERYEQGKVPRADYLREEAELAKARIQVNDDYKDYNIALLKLKVALGVNLGSLISLRDPLQYAETKEALASYLARAGKNRPEIAQAESKIAEMKAKRMVALSQYSPQINLFGLGSNITGSSPDGNANGRWGGFVSVIGSVTLFDSGRRLNELRASNAAVREATIASQKTRLQVSEDVSEAWIRLDLNRRNIEQAQQEVVSAEEDHRLIHQRYLVGKSIALDDFEAGVKLLQARLAVLQSIYNYRIAQARLIWASGDI